MKKLVRESLDFNKSDYHNFCEELFPEKKIVYYHADTDKFEYKGNFKSYDVTPTAGQFLRTKDILIYLYENDPIGFTDSRKMASYLQSGYGYLVGRLDLYKLFSGKSFKDSPIYVYTYGEKGFGGKQ